MGNMSNNSGLFYDFDFLELKLASPESILKNSYGEVKNAATINYKTFKPEKDGLFCQKIFGPISNYECGCGKYRGYKYNGLKCEKCGVDVVLSDERRKRMGHIDLSYPVVNTFFMRSNFSKIAILLGLKAKDIENVLYFERWIVKSVKEENKELKKMQVLTFDDYNKYLEKYGEDYFKACIGAKGILEILQSFDLQLEYDEIIAEMDKKKKNKKKNKNDTNENKNNEKLKNRAKLIHDFIKSGNKPEWMVMTRLPVLPPDIRPIVVMEGNKIAASDLNLLYSRIINRNNRIKRFQDIQAADIITYNECKMLQKAVDELFISSNSNANNFNNKKVKTISDFLSGKYGIIRQNLLGKRVDYSGRSVIVSGPELKLHQCGLPKDMALELFKPFIISKLKMMNIITTIKQGIEMIEKKVPEVYDCIFEIIKEHPVLLNRAPTLHRLGIQAFEPILIDTKAIQLHPLVCRGFNADFDGDQMAVHVPLSIEAQLEARILMLSSNNIMSSSDGKPMIVPRKDITVGLYYMTTIFNGEKNEGHTFYSYEDALIAFNAKKITLNTKVNCYVKLKNEKQDTILVKDTTIGRLMLMMYLPLDGKISIDSLNKQWGISFLTDLVAEVFAVYGNKVTVIFCDKIMKDGFKYATKSGISFGKNDICVPTNKDEIIKDVLDKVKDVNEQYANGYITRKEKYNKITDYWSECSDYLCNEVMDKLGENVESRSINSISLMMNSGARASKTQMKQLAGMKGLITKPNGEIIETPVISNFKEGLNMMEFFNAAHGARKGNVDTALKTADAGYLTRRLVDVAQDCIVVEEDCGSIEGVRYEAVIEDDKVVKKISDFAFGRFLAEDVVVDGKVIAKADTFVDKELATLLDEKNVYSVLVRSPVTCKCKNGICKKCYGVDISTLNVVNLGEAVGTIAAQTIGEPSTQLTLNTFHIGGIASKDIVDSIIKAKHNGIVKYNKLDVVVNKENEKIAVSQSGRIDIVDNKGNVLSSNKVEYSSKVCVEDGKEVKIGDHLYEYDHYNTYIVSTYNGKVSFNDMVLNKSYAIKNDNSSGVDMGVVTNWLNFSKKLLPSISIKNEYGEEIKDNGFAVRYLLPVGSILNVNDGTEIHVGDFIAKVPRDLSVIKDITGGLPRIEELFEARNPKNSAIIAGADGCVEFKSTNANITLILHADNGEKVDEYLIPKGRCISVRNGEHIRKGDIIVNGEKNPSDLLKYQGVSEVANYIVSEVQAVYKSQGININEKHIEVIIRYMLNRVMIDKKNDTHFFEGEKYNIWDVIEENEKVKANGGLPAEYHKILSGISQTSLQTSSFLSAASFKETVRVLLSAAIEGKRDNLVGMKESMIVGRLIPSGTGFVTRQLKKKAREVVLQNDA